MGIPLYSCSLRISPHFQYIGDGLWANARDVRRKNGRLPEASDDVVKDHFFSTNTPGEIGYERKENILTWMVHRITFTNA